jgi:hypothetical protein
MIPVLFDTWWLWPVLKTASMQKAHSSALTMSMRVPVTGSELA